MWGGGGGRKNQWLENLFPASLSCFPGQPPHPPDTRTLDPTHSFTGFSSFQASEPSTHSTSGKLCGDSSNQ